MIENYQQIINYEELNKLPTIEISKLINTLELKRNIPEDLMAFLKIIYSYKTTNDFHLFKNYENTKEIIFLYNENQGLKTENNLLNYHKEFLLIHSQKIDEKYNNLLFKLDKLKNKNQKKQIRIKKIKTNYNEILKNYKNLEKENQQLKSMVDLNQIKKKQIKKITRKLGKKKFLIK